MSLDKEASTMMDKAVAHLAEEYKSLRTNRVNPAMLDSLMVEAYGSSVGLKTVASISVQERNLIITPFDPGISGDIVKAINSSQMNLNAINDGASIRVPVPPLNEELRKDIAKQAKQKLEQAKISVREVRRKIKDAAKKRKADGDLTEDDIKHMDKKLQTLTDEMCLKLDKLYVVKEKEILTI
ncbi:MAG: Ribosome-recycling factor [Chlamydiia bacterium]|nr:Ribosome-recycling factor [Chlamydiia bacterium]MCH9624809.1 Ribosome-recycling factor [Chlamydiia bacterium]